MSSRRVALALGLCALAACGPLRHRGAEPPVVVFVNRSLDQADVFAVSGSAGEMRLGTVMPGHTAELEVPTAATTGGGSVRIVARILARSRTPSTGPVALTAGERVQVTLPMDENTLTVLPARTP